MMCIYRDMKLRYLKTSKVYEGGSMWQQHNKSQVDGKNTKKRLGKSGMKAC